MLEFSNTYPDWFLVFIPLSGLLYASVLYVRNRKYNFSTWLTVLFYTLRTIAVSLIVFLLFSPLLKNKTYTFEKPSVALYIDNSSSLTTDSSITDIPWQWEDFQQQLSEKYAIDTYRFGESVSKDSLRFEEAATNLSAVLRHVRDNHQNESNKAVVVAADGIYNKGMNPLYAKLDPTVRIITVGLGNPVKEKDIRIAKVRSNDIAFQGNAFPVAVDVKADLAMGETVVLKIVKNGETMVSENLKIDREDFIQTKDFYLEAEGEGVQRYSVIISSNDRKPENNQYDFFIEVIDEQSKILILSHAPHPDVTALRAAIASKKQYHVTTQTISDFDGSVMDYDLVILHQLPATNTKAMNHIITLYSNDIPVLFVLGEQTDIKVFNGVKSGLRIANANGSSNKSFGVMNESFALFTYPASLSDWLTTCPPLDSPFGEYVQSPALNTMLFQQLGDYKTRIPLISLSGNFAHKSAIIAGTGLWKWRMQDFALHGHHRNFDALMVSIVKYLALKQDKDFFRVFAQKRYPANAEVMVEAETYDAAYQMINDGDVKLELVSEKGEKFDFLMDKVQGKYQLNLGYLESGKYFYQASVTLNKKELLKKGSFMVIAHQLEKRNTTADFELLQKLADQHHGFFMPFDALDAVADSLLNENHVSIRYEETTYRSLLNNVWLLVLIIALLAIEWFLRKYHGGY